MSDNKEALKPQYGWTVSLFLPFTPKAAEVTANRGFTANQVSWVSLFVFIIGLAFYIYGRDEFIYRLLASAFFALGTFFDVLDGAVARYTETSSKYGSLLDSTIDLIRYNLFFASLLYLLDFNTYSILAFTVYVLLLNYSFITFIASVFSKTGRRDAKTHGLYDEFIPPKYKYFCLKHKLLFNPFNIEDQLLFMFFILGVVFQIEILVLYICLFFRMIDVILILRRKFILNKNN